MNQKITRRAVLGTVIAGLAAGPFVMRAWRKRNVISLPNPMDEVKAKLAELEDLRQQFFDEWKSLHIAPEVTPVPNIKTVNAAIDLSKVTERKFTYVSTSVKGEIETRNECTPENLLGYEICQGTLRKGETDNSLQLSIEDHEQRYVGFVENDHPNGEFILRSTKLQAGNMDVVYNTTTGFTMSAINGHDLSTMAAKKSDWG